MNDLEDFRGGDIVLRRLSAHIRRRDDARLRMAGATHHRRDNCSHKHSDKNIQKPTSVVIAGRRKGGNADEA